MKRLWVGSKTRIFLDFLYIQCLEIMKSNIHKLFVRRLLDAREFIGFARFSGR